MKTWLFGIIGKRLRIIITIFIVLIRKVWIIKYRTIVILLLFKQFMIVKNMLIAVIKLSWTVFDFQVL